jgi:hypothetical protein
MSRILSDEEIGEAMEYTNSGRRIYGRIVDWSGYPIRVEESSLAVTDAVYLVREIGPSRQNIEIERDQVRGLVSALTSFLADTDGVPDLPER